MERRCIYFALLAVALVIPSITHNCDEERLVEPTANRHKCSCRDALDFMSAKKKEVISSSPSKAEESPELPAYIDTCKCGEIREPREQFMIVRGMEVNDTKKYPWMVTLALKKYPIIRCGGSIINNRFILTAAHCVLNMTDDRKEKPLYVSEERLVIQFLTPTTMKMTSGSQVDKIIPYPTFDFSQAHDIALIRLSEPIQFNDYARPICLPSPEMSVEPGMIMVVAGRGTTMGQGRGGVMREGKIEVLAPGWCNTHLTRKGLAICLSGKGIVTPCYGDSGGPAFYRLNNRYYVMGVSSTGMSKCKLTGKVIYTSVLRYLDWIREVAGTCDEP